MAKYTELFAEYVASGGALPTTYFELIDDFEGLFKERFADREIGFETEELFAIKLDLRARLVMPVYAKRIAMLSAVYSIDNFYNKWHYEEKTYGVQHSETTSEGSNTELPYDTSSAIPAGTTSTEGSADIDAHTDKTEYKEGFAPDESLRLIEAFNAKAKIIVDQCLKEFENLFMKVY